MKLSDKVSIKHIIALFVLSLTVFLLGTSVTTVKAEEEDKEHPVRILKIDYDNAEILIDPNGNTKVYYSQGPKNTTWNEVEGVLVENGTYILGGRKETATYLALDISWISEKSDYELSLKGSEDETVVSATLPAANTKLKVTFDKVNGILNFENENGAKKFEWKKSTSYDWNTTTVSQDDFFREELEAFQVRGAKIVVRIPSVEGTSASDTGQRPSKMVNVSISKRANAPNVKINTSKLTANTSLAMQYRVHSVGSTVREDLKWIDCEKAMTVQELAPDVFSDGTTKGSDVTLVFRKAATGKAGHSKESYLTIPPQDIKPDVTKFVTTESSTKFSFSIPKASKDNAYQYTIVRYGADFDENKASWKSLTSEKFVSVNQKSYPAGSVIYIRTKGVNYSKKTSLKMPSAYAEIELSYKNVVTE